MKESRPAVAGTFLSDLSRITKSLSIPARFVRRDEARDHTQKSRMTPVFFMCDPGRTSSSTRTVCLLYFFKMNFKKDTKAFRFLHVNE